MASWLNTNVNPVGSAVTVDESLTISGSAADSKVVGDNITDLKNAIDDNGLNTNIATPPFVLGAITLTNQALVYSASTTSCVTVEGTRIVTEPGTIIHLTDANYKYKTWYTANNVKWYVTSSAYGTDDTVISKARQYVVQIARQDGGTITADEVAGKIQFVLPVTAGDRRDIGYYKTFALVDNLIDGNAPVVYGGGTAASEGGKITPFIPVKAGQKINYRLKAVSGYYIVLFYNKSLTFVDGIVATGNEDVGSYTFDSDGFVKASIITGYANAYLYFSNYAQSDRDALQLTGLTQDVSVNTATVTKLNNTVSKIDANIDGIVDTRNLFEIGNIAITTAGWTYSDSSKRIRTKEGVTIWLVPGDVISLTDYSNARFALGWLTGGGAYAAGGWKQEDYVVVQAGYYVILVSNLPEVNLSSIDDLLALVNITKCVNLAIKSKVTKSNMTGINHRGYNLIAPENTIPAFKLSKEMGFDWVETDVCWTSDGIPVLLHDGTIDRTSNGTGNIADMTYAQVSEYDFGSWKNDAYAGTKIPTLEDFLIYCKRSGLRAYLEIKSFGSSEERIKAIAETVKAYGLDDKMVWISFSETQLKYVRDVLPKATLGYIVSNITAASIATAAALKNGDNCVIFDSTPAQLTNENVQSILAEDLKIGAYIVDILANIIALNSAVEFVTTNVANVAEALYVYANH